MRNCKNCDEPSEPVDREHICPECRLERDIDKQDAHDAWKAEGVESEFFGRDDLAPVKSHPHFASHFVDDESTREEDEDFAAFHNYGWGDD